MLPLTFLTPSNHNIVASPIPPAPHHIKAIQAFNGIFTSTRSFDSNIEGIINKTIETKAVKKVSCSAFTFSGIFLANKVYDASEHTAKNMRTIPAMLSLVWWLWEPEIFAIIIPATLSKIAKIFFQPKLSLKNKYAPKAVIAGVVLITMLPETPEAYFIPKSIKALKRKTPLNAIKKTVT